MRISVFTLLLFIALACHDIADERKQYAGQIIEKAEQYKAQHGMLPVQVDELGLEDTEDAPAYYEKTSDTTYTVWYGLGVGESMVYHSQTGKWSDSH